MAGLGPRSLPPKVVGEATTESFIPMLDELVNGPVDFYNFLVGLSQPEVGGQNPYQLPAPAKGLKKRAEGVAERTGLGQDMVVRVASPDALGAIGKVGGAAKVGAEALGAMTTLARPFTRSGVARSVEGQARSIGRTLKGVSEGKDVGKAFTVPSISPDSRRGKYLSELAGNAQKSQGDQYITLPGDETAPEAFSGKGVYTQSEVSATRESQRTIDEMLETREDLLERGENYPIVLGSKEGGVTTSEAQEAASRMARTSFAEPSYPRPRDSYSGRPPSEYHRQTYPEAAPRSGAAHRGSHFLNSPSDREIIEAYMQRFPELAGQDSAGMYIGHRAGGITIGRHSIWGARHTTMHEVGHAIAQMRAGDGGSLKILRDRVSDDQYQKILDELFLLSHEYSRPGQWRWAETAVRTQHPSHYSSGPAATLIHRPAFRQDPMSRTSFNADWLEEATERSGATLHKGDPADGANTISYLMNEVELFADGIHAVSVLPPAVIREHAPNFAKALQDVYINADPEMVKRGIHYEMPALIPFLLAGDMLNSEEAPPVEDQLFGPGT